MRFFSCFAFLVSLFLGSMAAPSIVLADDRDDDDRYDDDEDDDEGDRDRDRGRARDRDDDRADVPPEWTRDKRGRPKKVLPAEDDEDPPPGYRRSTRSIRGLVIPGAIILPVAWAASSITSLTCVIVDAVPDSRCGVGEPGWGFLPLIGPFVVATADGTDPGWRAGYALYGAFQNAGLAMVIIGASIRRNVWELTPKARREAEEASVFFGPGTVGVRGTF